MPLYEYMVLASSFDAARTVIRCPLLSSYSRHCTKQMLSPRAFLRRAVCSHASNMPHC